MIRCADRRGASRLLGALAGVVVLAACDFHFRASVEPVSDEVSVQARPTAGMTFDHPARLSAQDLASILQGVRVEFKSHWLQKLITGPLDPAPLFEESALARVAPLLVEALEKAGPHDRIVFYVAQRRSSDRRDVTSGTLFVKGRGLTISLANYQNRVDVVPGLAAYDRETPEVAVAPQRYSLAFDRSEYVIDPGHETIGEALGTAPPTLMVDYARFLQSKSRAEAAHGPYTSTTH